MNKRLKDFADAINLQLNELKKHLEATTYTDLDMKELRASLKSSATLIKRIRMIDRAGNIKIQPPLASLPARTPATSLQKGLGYAVRIERDFVYIGKVRITEVLQRKEETLVSYEGIPPYYESLSTTITLFHSQPRQPSYLVQIPAGQKSIRGFPVGIFKRP